MERSRDDRLQELLRRLGSAVHGSVVQSDEVHACLRQLSSEGWDAVMLLEASLACRASGSPEPGAASVHVHVDSARREVGYRIDARDAELLSSLGISPTRHRSAARLSRKGPDDEPDL